MTTMKQNVASGARAGNVLDAALYYAALGLSVIPCRGKKCALLNWKLFQEQRATIADIVRWEQRGMLENVAIVCGRVSGNLVVLDLDGEDAIQATRGEFPDLLDSTYTVRTGSGFGLHAYFYTLFSTPETARAVGTPVGNVELRSDGAYVIAPPSRHPVTTDRYRIENNAPVLQVDHLRPVADWIKRLATARRPAEHSTPAVAPVRVSAWARAALTAETTLVRTAPAGARNDTLNRAAFKLGQLVQRGLLPRAVVEAELEEAAAGLAETDGLPSVRRTIASGLNAAARKPDWRAQS